MSLCPALGGLRSTMRQAPAPKALRDPPRPDRPLEFLEDQPLFAGGNAQAPIVNLQRQNLPPRRRARRGSYEGVYLIALEISFCIRRRSNLHPNGH